MSERVSYREHFLDRLRPHWATDEVPIALDVLQQADAEIAALRDWIDRAEQHGGLEYDDEFRAEARALLGEGGEV